MLYNIWSIAGTTWEVCVKQAARLYATLAHFLQYAQLLKRLQLPDVLLRPKWSTSFLESPSQTLGSGPFGRPCNLGYQ